MLAICISLEAKRMKRALSTRAISTRALSKTISAHFQIPGLRKRHGKNEKANMFFTLRPSDWRLVIITQREEYELKMINWFNCTVLDWTFLFTQKWPESYGIAWDRKERFGIACLKVEIRISLNVVNIIVSVQIFNKLLRDTGF